jgi:hypothetical protein
MAVFGPALGFVDSGYHCHAMFCNQVIINNKNYKYENWNETFVLHLDFTGFY